MKGPLICTEKLLISILVLSMSLRLLIKLDGPASGLRTGSKLYSLIFRWFENFIIVSILLNSVALSLYDYSDRDNITKRNQIIDKSMLAFNAIYVFEALIKILSLGFIVHKSSYLRDPWNVLDFLVVVSSIVEMSGQDISVRSIRSFRAIRPLRSVNAMPSMRKLVRTLMISLPNLVNVAFLLSYIIIMFGILGLHLFSGALSNRCRML